MLSGRGRRAAECGLSIYMSVPGDVCILASFPSSRDTRSLKHLLVRFMGKGKVVFISRFFFFLGIIAVLLPARR